MVLTILEAQVEKQYWQELPRAYAELATDKPEGLVRSYLAQNENQPELWRILTFWESQEALDAMRATGQTPTGIVIFQRVDATPEVKIYDIQQQTQD
jgi:quinol monooxygenase YgiN